MNKTNAELRLIAPHTNAWDQLQIQSVGLYSVGWCVGVGGYNGFSTGSEMSNSVSTILLHDVLTVILFTLYSAFKSDWESNTERRRDSDTQRVSLVTDATEVDAILW